MRRRIIREMCVTTAAILILAVLLCCAFSCRLRIREYTLASASVSAPVTIVHISDLHETTFGEDQSRLIRAIRSLSPDIVVMTGDMADGYREDVPLKQLVEAVAPEYPCYYVSGNHEAWSGRTDEYKAYYRQAGVVVLEGRGESITVGDAAIALFGIDDPAVCGETAWYDQLSACREQAEDSAFSVLLTHRPERIADYSGFDLVLSGHAHGGQVRIPYILNGLFAPDQGWFPEYAGGIYETDDGAMVVSRGLEINSLPRVFNRPELVSVTIVPA